MKTLFINRHAKSSWKDFSLKDFDRPLNKRGRINSRFMAQKFAAEEKVDLLISSPANRALSTAEEFAKALGMKEALLKDERVYNAGVKEMIMIICELDDSYDSVILFGHNPTFTSLVQYLDSSFDEHLVTCARAKVVFEVNSWNEISSDTGNTQHHIYPRMYDEMAHL